MKKAAIMTTPGCTMLDNAKRSRDASATQSCGSHRRFRLQQWLAILAAAAIFALAAAPVQADNIVIGTLDGVTFSDSATATGSFYYDVTTNTYFNIAITTTATPPTVFEGQTYPAPSSGTTCTPTATTVCPPPPPPKTISALISPSANVLIITNSSEHDRSTITDELALAFASLATGATSVPLSPFSTEAITESTSAPCLDGPAVCPSGFTFSRTTLGQRGVISGSIDLTPTTLEGTLPTSLPQFATIDDAEANAVASVAAPEPSSFTLLGSGLLGLMALSLRRKTA
jgi:hypothetical protein